MISLSYFKLFFVTRNAVFVFSVHNGSRVRKSPLGWGYPGLLHLQQIKINFQFGIKIKQKAEAEKSRPKPPSEVRNFVIKLIGTNPRTSNITKWVSSIQIRGVEKTLGKKFGTGSGSHLGAVFGTHPSRIRTHFRKKFLNFQNKPLQTIVDTPSRCTYNIRTTPKSIIRKLRGSECLFLPRFWGVLESFSTFEHKLCLGLNKLQSISRNVPISQNYVGVCSNCLNMMFYGMIHDRRRDNHLLVARGGIFFFGSIGQFNRLNLTGQGHARQDQLATSYWIIVVKKRSQCEVRSQVYALPLLSQCEDPHLQRYERCPGWRYITQGPTRTTFGSIPSLWNKSVEYQYYRMPSKLIVHDNSAKDLVQVQQDQLSLKSKGEAPPTQRSLPKALLLYPVGAYGARREHVQEARQIIYIYICHYKKLITIVSRSFLSWRKPESFFLVNLCLLVLYLGGAVALSIRSYCSLRDFSSFDFK